MNTFQNNYNDFQKKIRVILKEYGEKGFGIYLNEGQKCIVLSPFQLNNGIYDFSLYHKDDDTRCKYYGIAPEDRR